MFTNLLLFLHFLRQCLNLLLQFALFLRVESDEVFVHCVLINFSFLFFLRLFLFPLLAQRRTAGHPSSWCLEALALLLILQSFQLPMQNAHLVLPLSI